MKTSFRRLVLALTVAIVPALPASAESLADVLVAAYRHSALLEQNRAVVRAADENVAQAMSALRPVVQWAASHSFRQVEGALRTGITSGALAPGTKLPSTRSLAGDLGVARITVGSAYAALERDGLVEGRTGAGTLVAAAPPAATGRREPSAWPR